MWQIWAIFHSSDFSDQTVLHKSLSFPQGKLSSLLILSKLDAIAKTFRLQKLVKGCLLLTIRAYQRYISPHKGFSCAYRILHQEQSCSSYFKTCITEQSFDRAYISFRQRLQDCHQANLILQANSRQQRKANQRRRRRNSSCYENNNCFYCDEVFDPGLLFFFCNPFECIDCGDCDF